MSLLDRCTLLQQRVDRLKDLHETAAEAEALSQRLSEARELMLSAQKSHEKIQYLKESQIEFDTTVVDQIDPISPLGKIFERFTANPEAASLSRGRDWAKFQDQSRDWNKALATEATRSWRAFVDRLSRGQSPEGLKAKLAQTDTNNRALEEFSRVYVELKKFRAEFPQDRSTAQEAVKLSEELKRVSEEFDYDVPEDVKKFLAAIHKGGAPLHLLTEEVLFWLKKNRSEDQYQIVGRR